MKYLIALFAILFAFSLQAQDKGVVSGKILDAERYNEPLLMASISLKGTAWSTQTNFNGNFEITDVTPGKYIMQIRFLGYEDVFLPIVIGQDNTTQINHSLKAKTLTRPDMAETNLISSKTSPVTSNLK
jgi:iron complex outermembrane receptor protein